MQSTENFWQFDSNYWFQKLNSSNNGLSQITVDKIHLKSKKNKKNKSLFVRDLSLFLSQFNNPLMILLIGAVVLSAFVGDTSDVFIILFIVIAAGLLSFFQERNANRFIDKLKAIVAHKCSVLRDGIVKEINSTDIIAGDIIILKAGDMLPADCLLIESNELHANEASLTGESFPTSKQVGVIDANTELSDRINCLWEGTNIISGTAKAIVINIGETTVFDTISKSATTIIETTFEKGIKDFGYLITRITLFLSLFILIVNLINHKSAIESALFALALAVGMAPELLPAVATIAMSAGARRLLDKKVIVRKLSSIQNLGEINLLCTDKTGTITEGVIAIEATVDGIGNEDLFVKELAYWNAFFQSGYSNPIDSALKKMALETKTVPTKFSEIPYDFIRKRVSIGIVIEDKKRLICKGAFNQILPICSSIRWSNGIIEPIENYLNSIESKYEEYGIGGFRAIGICYKDCIDANLSKTEETNMTFAGFILLEDNVKSGIIETITELKKLQVHLKIISGDNINVAKSIAIKIGIENPLVMTGKELFNVSPEALKQLVKKTYIFAEVEPQQKEHIIQALRSTYTVAYLGDGINDVSAICAADVGISVENAVDIARESADFVLMEKDLMVIADGIKEGRKTFANTLKYIFINTGSTFGNMFSVAIASLLLPFIPMLPKQILLTNFITDFPYLTIASDNVDQEQLNKPGKWNLKLIRNYMLVFGIHSSVFDVITFYIFLYVLKVRESAFQTAWFIESIVTELLILFIIRTYKSFIKSKPGKYLFVLSIIGFLITIYLPYSPFSDEIGLTQLPIINLATIIIIVIFYVITLDLLKISFFKKYKNY